MGDPLDNLPFDISSGRLSPPPVDIPDDFDLPSILSGLPPSASGTLLAAFVTDIENFGGMNAHEIMQQVSAFSPNQVTGDADAWRLFHTSMASAIDGLSADAGRVEDTAFQGALPDAVRTSHQEFLRESAAFAAALTAVFTHSFGIDVLEEIAEVIAGIDGHHTGCILGCLDIVAVDFPVGIHAPHHDSV